MIFFRLYFRDALRHAMPPFAADYFAAAGFRDFSLMMLRRCDAATLRHMPMPRYRLRDMAYEYATRHLQPLCH